MCITDIRGFELNVKFISNHQQKWNGSVSYLMPSNIDLYHLVHLVKLNSVSYSNSTRVVYKKSQS